jgi:lysophospholipase L1-like esterase
VAVAAASLIFSLLALELGLRVLDRRVMIYDLEMWKYAKYVKREADDPAIGHEHVPKARARLDGVQVAINSHGLRDDEYDYAKPRDTVRILVLGDSNTFGWGVLMEATYPKQLERLLNERGPGHRRYEVINAGVGNYNTAMEIAYLEKRGLRYSPDVVIVGWFINDAEPTPRRVISPILEHSHLAVLGLMSTRYLLTYLGLEPDYRRYYSELYQDEAPGWATARSALLRLGRLAREHAFTPIIVLLPDLHVLQAQYPFDDAHRKVSTIARSENIVVLDGLEVFQGMDGHTLWVSRSDTHMNAKAHAIIARALFDFLRARSLVPDRRER